MVHGMQVNVMCQPRWEGLWGENGYMYMAESLHCSPETITIINWLYPNTKCIWCLKKKLKNKELFYRLSIHILMLISKINVSVFPLT